MRRVTTTNPDTTSTIKDENNSRPSMLYNVLPSMVSNRMPTLPSFRRSFSSKRHGRLNSSTELPRPRTPPPNYTSRPASGTVTPNLMTGETDFEFSDDASERPGSSSSALPPPFMIYETKTGINWKYARSGISILTQACRESTASLRELDETCTSLVRQLYIHGVTYFLRGLPADLSPEETFGLEAAVPQSVVELRTNTRPYDIEPMSQRGAISREATPEPTVLHRLTATVVFQTFIFIQFLLPYIKLLLTGTIELERKHQITKRLVNTSVTTVHKLGRRSLRLSQTVCQMNDGKVGQAINDMTIWWVKSVTGGVQQGFEEGLSSIRAGPECSRARVTVEE